MLYKETNFKTVEELEIPRDWNGVKLQDILTYTKGRKPESYLTSHENNSTPYLSTEYLRQSIATQFVIPNEKLVKASVGEVILLWDGSNAGEFFVSKDGVLSTTMVKFELKSSNLDRTFLFYLLKTKENYIKSQTNGTGIPHVSPTILNNLILALPSLAEQQKIAEILSNIDTAIQKTNELITSTQRLKTGFMQVLLEKGIEHKKFSDTKVGTIPENWKIMPLKDVCIEPESSNKPLPDKFEYVDVSSVSNVDFKIHQTTRHTLTTAPSRAKKLIRKDDIILATVRPTLKRIAMIPEELDRQVCSTAFCIVRVNRERVNPKFIFYLLQSDSFIDAISIHQVGATYPAISDSIVLNQFIYIPSLEESNRIVEIISDVDKKLDSILLEKRHLEKIKKKFMGELLSGRIRVK